MTRPAGRQRALSGRVRGIRGLGIRGLPAVQREAGVGDGTRTRGHRDHNPVLYRLSYAHHANRRNTAIRGCRSYLWGLGVSTQRLVPRS